MKHKLLCPECKHHKFRRTETLIIEMFDDGEGIRDEIESFSDGFIYGCLGCGMDVTNEELVKEVKDK